MKILLILINRIYFIFIYFNNRSDNLYSTFRIQYKPLPEDLKYSSIITISSLLKLFPIHENFHIELDDNLYDNSNFMMLSPSNQHDPNRLIAIQLSSQATHITSIGTR
ncbi:hypothetical protein RCL_jg28575.t1 [Rhizophagus clarus]|uniref:Uncharacterized protein n=1 Tax=Rhizophagus clarus TaxID=94130 RepID=A0A8H3QTJ7_9GLOM|nr:hypothetical protein RCL_jg28575.t1 [Rhizophagus clarus]